MTSSVKPPGGGSVADSPAAQGDEASAAASEAELAREVETAKAAGTEPTEASAASKAPASSTSEIAEAMQTGQLDREAALDLLVEQAVARGGQGMSEAGRAEMAEYLRDTLSNDPNLQSLLDAMGSRGA